MKRETAKDDELGIAGADNGPAPVAVQQHLASTVISPAVNASQAVKDWIGLHGMPFDRGLLLEMEAQIAAIKAGDLDRPTALLAAHIETLNAVFYGLIKSAFEYRGNPYQEDKLRLALRVQSQIRATIQVVSDLKNPRSVNYVKQANIGHAVQVNNGLTAEHFVKNPQDELL
jgi:hypothetical protein